MGIEMQGIRLRMRVNMGGNVLNQCGIWGMQGIRNGIWVNCGENKGL